MSAPVSEVVSLVYDALDVPGNQESASVLSCASGEGMVADEDSEEIVCEQCPEGEHYRIGFERFFFSFRTAVLNRD